PFVQQDGPIRYSAVFAYRSRPAAPASKEAADFLRKTQPRLDQADVEKADGVRHEVDSWNDRTDQSEAWYAGSERLDNSSALLGGAPGIRAHPTGGGAAQSFPELTWLSPDDYQGGIRQGETTIAVFRHLFQGDEQVSAGFLILFSTEATVYIDTATHLPLALKTSRYTLTYKYSPAPAHLELPPEYKEAYQTYQDRLHSIPPPP
ncbi:MAG TPA: hypothetical protein VIM58_03030, partial [Candidatus Methylacidiphilales bacterium]